MNEAIETEAKFVCPAGLTAADVSSALERMGLNVRWSEPQTQTDTYFDTTDGVLREADVSLRLRRYGATCLGTLKLPQGQSGAVMERQEIEWTISLDNAPAWERSPDGFPAVPPEAAAQLREHGVQSVAPVLTVTTVRRKGQAVDANGFVAEVALDESTFTGRRGDAQQRELELELKAGLPNHLREVAQALGMQFDLQPSARSKFSAGMERVG
jgi:triphosphatase